MSTKIENQFMEPWEIKPDDERQPNSKVTFIIFCEDGAVEPAYFRTFRSDRVHVSAIGNKDQHHAQVDYVTEYFREKGFLEFNKEEEREVLKVDEGAQVWCVFDRDKNEGDGKDSAFNSSIENAKSKGIRVAWSNDDFELWVLLHFEDIDPTNPDYINREKYYSRLTEILKKIAPQERIFQHQKFDYYSSMKSKKRFIRYTYQYMKNNIDEAIKRAEKLEIYHSKSVKPPHMQCPCTKVHHLITEILSFR